MTIAQVPEALRIIDEKRRDVGAWVGTSGGGDGRGPRAGFLNGLAIVAKMAADHIQAAHDNAMDGGDLFRQGEVAWRLSLLDRILHEAVAA